MKFAGMHMIALHRYHHVFNTLHHPEKKSAHLSMRGPIPPGGGLRNSNDTPIVTVCSSLLNTHYYAHNSTTVLFGAAMQKRAIGLTLIAHGL
jgi:hypothetical protein